MSVQIDTAFVEKYRSELMILAGQMDSRLENAVTKDSEVTGNTVWLDQIGHVEAQENTSRNSDTPITDVPFERRRIDIRDYDVYELIDQNDTRKMLAGPVPKVAMVLMGAMKRKLDKTILTNYFGTNYTDHDGGTATSFLAANQVAVNSWKYGAGSGNAGLTISKLIEAKTILSLNQVVPYDQGLNELHAAMTATQVANLLSTTEATSADFAEIKALVRGEINQFMGITFHVLDPDLVPTDGSGYRRVAVWQKAGVYLGMQQAITGQITMRADKRNAWQASCVGSWGCARTEEKRCVEIKCLET